MTKPRPSVWLFAAGVILLFEIINVIVGVAIAAFYVPAALPMAIAVVLVWGGIFAYELRRYLRDRARWEWWEARQRATEDA